MQHNASKLFRKYVTAAATDSLCTETKLCGPHHGSLSNGAVAQGRRSSCGCSLGRRMLLKQALGCCWCDCVIILMVSVFTVAFQLQLPDR